MTRELENQIAVVTGGNSGIGKAVCLDLARQGAKVILFGRNKDRNEQVRKELEDTYGFGEAYDVDVSSHEDIKKAFDDIYARHGKVDILVSNAGGVTAPSFGTKMSDEDFDKEIKIQIYGAFYCIKECGEKMKEQKYGRIVVTASLASLIGLIGNVNYGVAKTGLMGLVYTFAKEFGGYGITVNAVQPGVVLTPAIEGALVGIEDSFIKETPINRFVTVEDVANAVSFLCNPRTSGITGIGLPVDGGYVLECGLDRFMKQVIQ